MEGPSRVGPSKQRGKLSKQARDRALLPHHGHTSTGRPSTSAGRVAYKAVKHNPPGSFCLLFSFFRPALRDVLDKSYMHI